MLSVFVTRQIESKLSFIKKNTNHTLTNLLGVPKALGLVNINIDLEQQGFKD